MRSTAARAAVAVACLAVGCTALAGCGQVAPAATPSPTPRPTPSPTPTPTESLTPHPVRAVQTEPPPWLGTRVLPTTAAGFGVIRRTPKELRDREFTLPDKLPELPGSGFAARVQVAPPKVIKRSTWRPGCPVSAHQLSWIQLTFWGFDHERHTGELLVNKSVADKVVKVFRELFRDRFPIEEMAITTKAEQKAPPTGDGNDTSAFNCRPTRGSTTFSQHAYGLAIDVNPFQNPYSKAEENGHSLVLPELASAYLKRGWDRPGMIAPRGPVVRAFADIGWGWGGSWHSLKDRMHFSALGR